MNSLTLSTFDAILEACPSFRPVFRARRDWTSRMGDRHVQTGDTLIWMGDTFLHTSSGLLVDYPKTRTEFVEYRKYSNGYFGS